MIVMERVLIDDYINSKLQSKLNKLVNLNLNFTKTWDLIYLDFEGNDWYNQEMIKHIKRYTHFLIWLRDNNKPRTNAFQIYKEKCGISNDNPLDGKNNFDLNEQLKDRQRIDEISFLMKHRREKDLEIAPDAPELEVVGTGIEEIIVTSPLAEEDYLKGSEQQMVFSETAMTEPLLTSESENFPVTEESALETVTMPVDDQKVPSTEAHESLETVALDSSEVNDYLTYTLAEGTVFNSFDQTVQIQEFVNKSNDDEQPDFNEEDLKVIEENFKKLSDIEKEIKTNY